MEMEQVRLRMQEQRDQTEAMIEQLMIAHEEARKERESLVVELASMSADSGEEATSEGHNSDVPNAVSHGLAGLARKHYTIHKNAAAREVESVEGRSGVFETPH